MPHELRSTLKNIFKEYFQDFYLIENMQKHWTTTYKCDIILINVQAEDILRRRR